MEGQNFLVYCDEKEGIKCLYRNTRYTHNYKQACTVFYEFIMGKNMKF